MNSFNLPGRRDRGPGGGRLERLRRWLNSLQPRQRWAVIAGAPLAALVIIAALMFAVVTLASGGDGGEKSAIAQTATPPAEGESEGLLSEDLTQSLLLAKEHLEQRLRANGIAGTHPEAPVPGQEGDRLIIAKIGVDAPITMRVVGPDGHMPRPEGPTDVAWYDFSAFQGLGGRPGVGGNTVLSGHVDYRDYGPAVFWDLRKLDVGDEIVIHLSDGSEYKYVVEWNRVVDSSAAVWNDIVAYTPQESVTLITCAGTFDPSTRSYDQRRVVWAVRVA